MILLAAIFVNIIFVFLYLILAFSTSLKLPIFYGLTVLIEKTRFRRLSYYSNYCYEMTGKQARSFQSQPERYYIDMDLVCLWPT